MARLRFPTALRASAVSTPKQALAVRVTDTDCIAAAQAAQSLAVAAANAAGFALISDAFMVSLPKLKQHADQQAGCPGCSKTHQIFMIEPPWSVLNDRKVFPFVTTS
jgi:hypothetical protein